MLTAAADWMGGLHRGDIIEASGTVCKTDTGELGLRIGGGDADRLHLLAPCLAHLPGERSTISTERPSQHLLVDPDYRCRMRHLDLLVDPQSQRTFRQRSKAISFLRNWLTQRGFLEVETPILSGKTGGAMARPFLTALEKGNIKGEKCSSSSPLSLRIAPELFLKRLVVGGFERVFEIGKVFRNEGIDSTHNPEFTTCEFYQAYTTVEEMMALLEQFLIDLTQGTHLRSANGTVIELKRPFRRIDLVSQLEGCIGRKLPLELEGNYYGIDVTL